MNLNKKFAPVLIITLNRDKHFKACVKSLSQSDNAYLTDLYIALDYPLFESHWEGYNKIQSFIKTISGFKSITVIKREFNFGIQKNYFEAINFVFEQNDRLIFSEDDNVFSYDFLNFMNNCLEIFEFRSDVFSVSGYNYPINFPNSHSENVYLWQGHSAWGVGFWRDKYKNIDWTNDLVQSNVKKFLKNYISVFRFNKIANIYIPALLHMNNLNVIHSDIYICMYQYINKMYSIFPIQSRVRNIGNDGSGENCAKLDNDIFASQEIYQGSNNYLINKNILPNNEVNKILNIHFKMSVKFKIKTFLILIISYFGIYKSSKF